MNLSRCNFARLVLPLALLLAIGAGTVPAQNAVVWTTNFYSITGATLREIRGSLETARPKHLQGRVDGQTDWRIEWHFATQSTPTGCRCSGFSTRTVITVTLPRWRAPTNAVPSVLQEWSRYSGALGRHEAGHAQIALAGAAEMLRRTKDAGEAADCEGLKTRLQSLAHQVVEVYRKRDADYDEQTQHGATQGAVWAGRMRRGPDAPP